MEFRVPVAINPFKTRTPTTSLGKFGKALNPFNPVNAALMLLEEVIQKSPLPPKIKAFTSYAQFGMPGVVFGLTERAAGAENEKELIKKSLEYFADKEKIRNETSTTRTDSLIPSKQQEGIRTHDAQRTLEAKIPLVSFPTTPAGQYARYFKTPEFDYVFGEASRIGEEPRIEEMLRMAGQLKAEKDKSLATYYRAQSAAGRANIDEIKKNFRIRGRVSLSRLGRSKPNACSTIICKKYDLN